MFSNTLTINLPFKVDSRQNIFLVRTFHPVNNIYVSITHSLRLFMTL